MANFELRKTDGGFITSDYVQANNYKDAFLKVYSIDTAHLRYNPSNNSFYYKEGKSFLIEILSYEAKGK